MTNEHLGLFDKPPTSGEIKLSVAVVAVLFAASLAILPVHEVPVGQIAAFLPAVIGMMFVGDLIIATKLYAQAAVFRSLALTVLASGFVFIATLLIPYLLTFPGVTAPDGLIGDGTNTPAWIMFFRRLGLPIAMIIYAALDRIRNAAERDLHEPPRRVIGWVAGAVALAGVLAVIPTVWPEVLPPIFSNRVDVDRFNLVAFNIVNMLIILIAMGMLFGKRKTVLDILLLTALAGWLIQSLLMLNLHARFTIGWYVLYFITVISHLFVLVMLIAESNRLYARLAIALADRNVEREARTMSMDAVAAAFSHEVGQPLAASNLHSSASLRSLTAPTPDTDDAIRSLREAIDEGRRAFKVMRSIRPMFDKGSRVLTEFDLNDLVRETAALRSRDLAAKKISLQLSLAGDLPPIMGNRIQIQRILVNLLSNAIEAFPARGKTNRDITIRSTSPDSRTVLIEVMDSGRGIPPDELPEVFDPFFTTKSHGTGVGLYLSRTIAEEHGGRLWASPAHGKGTIFHLQLPSAGSPTS